eukprot:sb/3466762/
MHVQASNTSCFTKTKKSKESNTTSLLSCRKVATINGLPRLLYSEYAEDEKRLDRIREEELQRDEEALAREEEEFYSQKAMSIREFYTIRPSPTPGNEAATTSGANNFADFASRYPSSPTSEDDRYSVITTPAVNVTQNVLSNEASNKLLRDIDLVLQSVDSDGSADIDFTPTEFLNNISPDDSGDIVSEYFLTNIDLTPSPNDDVTQMTSSSRDMTSHDHLDDVIMTSRDHVMEDELSSVSLNTENATFDPFTEFKVKSSVDNGPDPDLPESRFTGQNPFPKYPGKSGSDFNVKTLSAVCFEILFILKLRSMDTVSQCSSDSTS